MKKITTLFALGLLLFSSCKKQEGPATEPQPQVQLSRTIFYPATTEAIGASYGTSQIQHAILQITADNTFHLSFGVPAPQGHDNVTIVLPIAKLKPGYTGDYTIVKGNDGNSGDAKVSYSYIISNTAASLHLPGMAEGLLKITGYNATAKTLSGTYTFQINSDQDPMLLPPNNVKENRITVTGSFENVQVRSL